MRAMEESAKILNAVLVASLRVTKNRSVRYLFSFVNSNPFPSSPLPTFLTPSLLTWTLENSREIPRLKARKHNVAFAFLSCPVISLAVATVLSM